MPSPFIPPVATPATGFIALDDGTLVSTANVKTIGKDRRAIHITHNDGSKTSLTYDNEADAAGNFHNLVTQLSGGPSTPTITAIDPSTIATTDDVVLNITGTNFLFGCSISIVNPGYGGGTTLVLPAPLSVSPTQIAVACSQVGLVVGTGTCDVVYTGPDGQTATASAALTIT